MISKASPSKNHPLQALNLRDSPFSPARRMAERVQYLYRIIYWMEKKCPEKRSIFARPENFSNGFSSPQYLMTTNLTDKLTHLNSKPPSKRPLPLPKKKQTGSNKIHHESTVLRFCFSSHLSSWKPKTNLSRSCTTPRFDQATDAASALSKKTAVSWWFWD